MQVKSAAIRSARTVLQVLVGVLALATPIVAILPEDFELFGVKVQAAASAGVAVIVAVAAGLTSFIQNLAEDNTALNVPKG